MLLLLILPNHPTSAQSPVPPATQPARQYGRLPASPLPGDHLLEKYFEQRTRELSERCLAEVTSAEHWKSHKEQYRQELKEMLGLWPEPPRTDLKAVTTGTLDHPDFTVEKIQFQSMPGLYVTGNLYIPKHLKAKAPAILYVCGHGNVVKDGVSYGSKTSYQHHPAWFARNGYVSFVIDTLQLGEIQGIHHGLHREKMWWWISRGHTPAGVEAWNAIRALDYLETRPEVDATKFGITGRSGGGAYSWWTAAIDTRIKVAVPVAGITDMQNHVVDGVIEGHCDCMFMVNTYRWDFAKVAALISPRPLLLSNTDKDSIFPLDGVVRLHQQVRRIYQLEGAADKLGLLITEGPHKDTQELQVPAIKWFNRWLRNDLEPVPNFASKFFEPEQLKVFKELPADQRNTRIQETFVAKAPPPAMPTDAAGWARQREQWLTALKAKTFAAWPADDKPAVPKHLFSETSNGVELHGFEIESQQHVPLRLYVAIGAQVAEPDLVVVNVVDQKLWETSLATYKPSFAGLKDLTLPDAIPGEIESTMKMLKGTKWAMAYVAVRGIGPTAWSGDEKRLTHLARRFSLLGEPLDGMRVWDVRRTIQAVRSLPRMKGAKIWLQGQDRMAGIALYASLFEPDIARLDLWHLPTTHDQGGNGPDLLNVLQVLDIPTAVAMAAERSKVRIYREQSQPAAAWSYPTDVSLKLGWGNDRVQLRDAR
ncbi:acetylxylan esterase [Humisphaera borealis]|uniref:Acetylxylan esterase n=2 Tax=Humisphaera borealis TaxID=2807512 RepID=A0A7M2X402_9BACT|nr:acetylxylan esterase [Humisphaera borealis]